MASNRKRVLVPEGMGKAGVDLLRAREDIELAGFPAAISGNDFRAMLGDVAGIALGVTPFGKAELDAAPAMQVIARIGVGYDAVDVPALTARGIPLMIAGTANSVSVAEHALHMIMNLAKRGPALDKLVREGNWKDRQAMMPAELAGKTVLIVGFGRIGTRLARRCLALETRVLVHDPYVADETIRAAGCEPVADLDAALPRADFVSINCPKTPETTGMFNAARLSRMKPSAFLVNTARGGIIDEPALVDALNQGRLAGAGLDVFETEPAPLSNPLLASPKVIASPHMAGVTFEAMEAMSKATAENILSVLDGAIRRENVVNQDVLSA